MRLIRQWVNKLSVKKKLVFYGYLTITPVLIIVCIGLIFNNYNKEWNERLNNDLSSVNTLADSVSVMQMEVKDFSTYICINDEIHNLLTADNPEELNKNSRIWFEEAPMELVQDMIALKGHIKTFAIYPENGITPFLRGMDGSAYVSNLNIVRKSDIYQETINSDNGMVWKSVPKGPSETYLSSRTDKVLLYREIFDLTQKKTLGYIVIGVSQERFQTMCQNILKSNKESVIILNKDGGELSRVGEINPDVEKYLKSEDFIKTVDDVGGTHFTYADYDIIYNCTDDNPSIVCKIVPRYGLQMQVMDYSYMPIMLLIGMLIGLMPLLLIISHVVTNPLSRVRDAIVKFSTGDFTQHVEVNTTDEIGEVARCFNKMVEDIKTLIDENYVMTIKEKESELAALQAQINPHFLYNTLDSLYWQATEEGNDEIAESILALSQLFRLVLSQGKKEVTVSQEIELISRYLQIQKMRFSDRLEYEIEIEDGINKARIPKLILQPFVENAIVHGFENISTPCKLTVSGKLQNKFMVFEIKDTGIGMRQDQIDAIWEQKNDPYAKQRIGSYAIKNIIERLRLQYGEEFNLDIASDVGHGTTVILQIPYEKEEVLCH